MGTVGAIALAIVIGEGILRWRFGFGTPPLYVADPHTGYRLKPDQQIRRFGNRISVNAHSMRGPALTPEGTTLRVLLLGDSIANGGWWTDDENTLGASLERELVRFLPIHGLSRSIAQSTARTNRPIEVLNASANSWGPRNELGYLRAFGTFSAKAIVLLINTDDLFAAAPSSVRVGRDPNYPDREPPLAWIELWQRLRPAPPPQELQNLPPERGDIVGINLGTITQIRDYARDQHAVLVVAITPLRREVQGQGRDYEAQARDRLGEFVAREGIGLLDFLPAWRDRPQGVNLFRDSIHLSDLGNELVSRAIAERVARLLDRS
ncbi:MAG: SGNH/GDSL hydrolase family protein [Oscillatoriales cyanobacterium]|nr:MAG: SGNH/GDSL hydrolase family protein [Oscillatoriales cyanobacterium]